MQICVPCLLTHYLLCFTSPSGAISVQYYKVINAPPAFRLVHALPLPVPHQDLAPFRPPVCRQRHRGTVRRYFPFLPPRRRVRFKGFTQFFEGSQFSNLNHPSLLLSIGVNIKSDTSSVPEIGIVQSIGIRVSCAHGFHHNGEVSCPVRPTFQYSNCCLGNKRW